MALKYLLKRMKKNGGLEDREADLSRLNYKVGNTSGMDVTNDIPSALAERVGRTAQRGGGEMEIQVENPSSFHLDREPLYNVIEQLGLDVSFHSDPNVGYTSAYRTGQGRGFNPTHQYFTSYLQEFASFKEEKKARGLSFNISRINPHVSTDEIPALEERMAQDVSVDPFGIPIDDLTQNMMDERNKRKANIFRNKDFLEDFYYTFYRREARFPFEQYSVFASYSDGFDRIWKKARHEACWRIYSEEIQKFGRIEDILEAQLSMAQTVSMTDKAVDNSWYSIVEQQELDPHLEMQSGEVVRQHILEQAGVGDPDELEGRAREIYEEADQVESREIETLADFDEALAQERPISEFRLLNRFLRDLDEEQFQVMFAEDNAVDVIREALKKAFDKLWKPPSHEDSLYDDVEDAHISIDGKMQGLQRRLEVQQLRVIELAYEIGTEGEKYNVNGYDLDLDSAASKVFAGDKDFFEDRDRKNYEELHADLLRRVLESQRFERALRMESVIFYEILPAWMANADNKWLVDGEVVHRPYSAPEFIWETVVEDNWDFEFGEDYFEMLENNQDFQRDVAAASAALYVWGHFTQRESKFQMDGNQYIEKDYDRCTWVEWMNRYGIGVNMEAMQGSPQQEFKLWKPKHIVAACHAVNITSRRQLETINDELYGAPMKFTIDLEHTSSFGTDPWREMEELIEQQEKLAESEWDVKAEKERPLAGIVRMYHLTKPGQETTQGTGHLHGPFRFGDKQLYTWLHDMVKAGFAQSDERASVMYEIGGDQTGTVQKAKLSMNMIEMGIEPEKVDPSRVDPGKNFEDEEEALIARFFRMDRPHYSREWAKIEEHAFDPLKGLLEASEFEYTWTSSAALDRGKQREFPGEEYR
ncbi:MAG: hypothetical protein ACLFTA_00740 [Candidatus Nanohaloarchaea archaeon]